MAEVLTPKYLAENYQRKGMTMEQIAAETGFCHDAVSYRRRADIAVRPVRLVTQYHIDRKQLSRLRRQSVSTKEIAAMYGCSVTTVERALRRFGLMAR